MSLRFAERMSRLGTESAFEVLAEARGLEAQGRHIVHLEIGEPDFATPANIIEAAAAAMHGGFTHYTPASGIREVREAVAAYVSRRTGTAVTADRVVLVPGTKNLVLFALLALVEPGDEVIVPDPGYPAYASLTAFLGAMPIGLPIREENRFRIDVDELDSLITPRTRVLVVNSPANPTGGVLLREDCERIAEVAAARDLVVLSDEIYSRLVYDGEDVSLYGMEGMAARTVLIDGLSKGWAMCGWRLGYGVMPVELAQRMDKLMINTSSCAAAFTQMAAVEALGAPESERAVEEMRAEFRRRRDIVVEGLSRLPGVRCHVPAGAFYAFPNIEGTGRSSAELSHALLHEAGVATLAGTCFGRGGEGYIRLSYANSQENLREALERIGHHLAAAAPVRG